MNHPVEVRLLEALIPPQDFELMCLVGTTYSLSPAVFLAIVSAASFDWNSRGGSVGFESLTKEEWRALILEKRQNCLMFVDHHGAFETSASGLKPLEKVSLDQVIKKRGRDTNEGGSLHSKLLVALYKDSKNIVIGRMYVGSKNFTSSNMREFGVIYDLKPSASVSYRNVIEPLVDYLEYLRDEEGSGTRASRLRPLIQALELLKTESLDVDDTSCAFHWQGRQQKKKQTKSLAEQLQHLLRPRWGGVFIHSPWTRASTVRHFADLMPNIPIQISCLKEPGLSTLKRPNVRYQLSYSASGQVHSFQSHAKIYFFSSRDDSVLVFGSANLTPDGWGLGVPGCRPNAEILLSTKVMGRDYRYLSEISGRMEEVTSVNSGPTVQEQVLSLLNAIQVRVSFVREPAHLRYEIDQQRELVGFKERVQIFHVLIETSGSDEAGEISICDGWPLPSEVQVPWGNSDLFRVSSLIRICCPTHAVETHLVVDLDSEFYDGRGKLRVLQYRSNEILESLAQILDVVLPLGGPASNCGDGSHHEQLSGLLNVMKVERYAYKMSRLKLREPTTYRRIIDRVIKLIAAAEADESLSSDFRFKKLVQTVEYIHSVLSQA